MGKKAKPRGGEEVSHKEKIIFQTVGVAEIIIDKVGGAIKPPVKVFALRMVDLGKVLVLSTDEDCDAWLLCKVIFSYNSEIKTMYLCVQVLVVLCEVRILSVVLLINY